MICLTVIYLFKPGLEEDAIPLFRKLTAATRAEPGCRAYQVHRSKTDPRRFFLYELYDDQAALDAHRAAPHFAEYAAGALFPMLESRMPEIFEPLDD